MGKEIRANLAFVSKGHPKVKMFVMAILPRFKHLWWLSQKCVCCRELPSRPRYKYISWICTGWNKCNCVLSTTIWKCWIAALFEKELASTVQHLTHIWVKIRVCKCQQVFGPTMCKWLCSDTWNGKILILHIHYTIFTLLIFEGMGWRVQNEGT